MSETTIVQAISLPTTSDTKIEPLRLPTKAEIDAATEVLNAADTSARVVRVNGRFAAKVGRKVSLIEAETMKFLAANSKVRVPKVYDAFNDPEINMTYIIMDYIPGITLRDLLLSLNGEEKAKICELIKEQLTELRSIPPPDHFGMLEHLPYLDGVFWNRGLDLRMCGPFAKEEDLNRGMIEKLRQTESEDNGAPDFKVTLIDWESSGWYPEYWDFCNATIACRFKRDWIELVPDILDEYPLEFLMMQVVYSSVYY